MVRCLAVLVALVLSLAACRPDPPLAPVERESVDSMDLSESDLEKCRSEPILAPACPRRVPTANEEEDFHHRAAVDEVEPDHFIFEVEWGAPHEDGPNEEDRPPNFSHLVLHAGDLSRAFAFTWPDGGKPKKGEPKVEDFGTQEWGDRIGDLVQAPPYPNGGIDGDHLVFRWREKGTDYAISLHTWLPVSETFSSLEEIVESIPSRH